MPVAFAGPAEAMVGSHFGSESLREFGQADVHRVKKGKKFKYKWKSGRCKYEFKTDHKGFKEKYGCK